MALTQSEKIGVSLPDFGLSDSSEQANMVSKGEFSLADAAEELSLHMAHRVEHKIHSELKIRPDRALVDIKIEAILLYLEKTWKGDAQAALDQLVTEILSGRSDPQLAVSRFTSSDTHQYLALNYVLQKAKQQSASDDLITAISDAYSELQERSSQAIHADINTIDAAIGYSNDVDTIEKFQNTYQDLVIDEPSLPKTFIKALELFGGRQISVGLQHLINALGLDLSSERPSVSIEKIHALITDIHQLQTIATTLESCEHIRGKLSESIRNSFNPDQLMRGIINLIDDKFVSATTILNLINGQGIQSVQDRIVFFTSTKLIIKEIPAKNFYDDLALDNAIESAQFALDHAIQEE